MSNYRKLSFAFVLVFCLSIVGVFSSNSWGSEVTTMELTKGKAIYNISVEKFGDANYFKVDDISKLLDIPYEVNPNGSVILGEGGTFVMGKIGSKSPVTIRKEQLQTLFAGGEPVFVTDNGVLYVQDKVVLGVFSNNLLQFGKTSYALDSNKSLKFYMNGKETAYGDYIILGDRIYVDMDTYLEYFSTKNGRFTVTSGWLRITDKNNNYIYSLKLNSNKDIDIKSKYIEDKITREESNYPFTKVEGKYYLELEYASMGSYLDIHNDIINIYDIEFIKDKLAVRNRVKNLQEIVAYMTGMENFQTSNKLQIYIKEDQGDFEKAGLIDLGYGSSYEGVDISVELSDDNNPDSILKNDNTSLKLYIDKGEKSVYAYSELGEKVLYSETVEKSMADGLQSIQFENNLYMAYLDSLFKNIPHDDYYNVEIYNDAMMRIISGLINDSMLVQDEEDYSYSLNMSNLLYVLKKEREDGNSIAGPLYDLMLEASKEVKFDFEIDFEFNEDSKKLTNITGEIIVESYGLDERAIKLVFRSYIKHD